MRHAAILALLTACAGSGDTADTGPRSRCDELGREARAFQEGSGALGERSGDAVVLTRAGETRRLSSDWSGCDSWIFLPSEPRQNAAFPQDYWASDHAELLEDSPDNVHYFFVPLDSDEADARLAVIEEGMEDALADLAEAEAADWRGRLHYVVDTPREIGGWLGDAIRDPGWGVVVGPDQTVRYMGSFADPERFDSGIGWFAPNLAKAANEARYGNFVVEREAALEAQNVDAIDVFTGQEAEGNAFIDVTFPGADTMAGYDTLEYDLHLGCVGEGEYGECPPWDYLVYLYQCDDAVDAPDAHASVACEPARPEITGTCHSDGAATAETCTSVGDCEDDSGVVWTCEGYEAAVAAEVRTGACSNPMGEPTEGTYTCNADGTGFEPLSCPCGTETGRWITTYHREGRWVHDATPYLALLKDGGTKTFRFRTQQRYELDLSFRLSNRGVGHRPTSLTPLYQGAYFGPDVNESYQPLEVEVPAGAAHVELATVVSGHGGGQLNCAEFCHTTNHFFVGSSELVVEDDWVDVPDGCEQQVDVGAVPNQYGTWWYGRNGWCPGMEVPVRRFDITAEAAPGGTVTFDHEVYGPGGIDLDGGGGERMLVESWMVVYE